MSAQVSLLDAVLAPRPVVVLSREAIVAWGCNAPGVPAHEVLPFVPGVSTETARARDLAKACRLLHYYAAYGPDEPPAKLLPRLREEIAALGGDPDEPTDTSPCPTSCHPP